MNQFVFGGTGFGPTFAVKIRRDRVIRMRCHSNWQRHLDEVFMKINGRMHYLWRAVDHQGEVLESYVTKRRDRIAALKFIKKSMKRYGRPEVLVTEKLRSYGAAMKVIGNADRQETGPLAEQPGREFTPAVSGEGSGLCCATADCEVCRSSYPSTLQFIITSTRNAASVAEKISNSSAPPISLSGGSWVWPDTCHS